MAIKVDHLLGINARNFEYLSRYNSVKGRRIANSKLITKSILRKVKISTPRLFRVFRNESEISRFDFTKLPESFVIKPNKGLGGGGIVVVDRLGEKPGEWVTTTGDVLTVRDMELHIQDILEGRFSIDDAPDYAFIEERIRIHPVFEHYAQSGTPDIRVIVFNRIPVMAMLRLPTKESGGRANLFQGAVGAGIDLATGMTTYGVYHGEEILFIPGTRRKVRGIEIPEWERVLEMAIRCQDVTGLGYLGADVVLQPSVKTPGKTIPKILELNAQPGLKIQICNKTGLRRRLQRVEGLEVDTPEQGIRIAKELFGDKEMAVLGKKIRPIGVFETVEVVDANGELVAVKVKVDTGADRSSIDKELAQNLGLLRPGNIIMNKTYRSALGVTERLVVGVTYYLAGRKIVSSASVSDRTGLKRPMLVGRRDLKGYVIGFN